MSGAAAEAALCGHSHGLASCAPAKSGSSACHANCQSPILAAAGTAMQNPAPSHIHPPSDPHAPLPGSSVQWPQKVPWRLLDHMRRPLPCLPPPVSLGFPSGCTIEKLVFLSGTMLGHTTPVSGWVSHAGWQGTFHFPEVELWLGSGWLLEKSPLL